MVVELYINDSKELFDKLYQCKNDIESKLGFALIWDRLDGKKASRIKYHIKGLNFDNHDNYSELMDTTISIAVKMRDVFKNYVS